MHFAAPGGNGYLLFSIIQETSYLVAFLLFHKLRHFLTAALHTLGAPSCQRTSCLVTNGAGDIPLQHNSLFLYKRRFRGDRRQQCLCIRMQRVVIQLIRITQLHDTSQIHNGDPVTYMLDNTQIMGDKHICQVILLPSAAG